MRKIAQHCRWLVALAALLVAGCASTQSASAPGAAPTTGAPTNAEVSRSDPEPEAEVPAAEAPVAATPATDASPAPAAESPSLADWTAAASVEGDYFVLGNPAAPIRLVDYSDFL